MKNNKKTFTSLLVAIGFSIPSLVLAKGPFNLSSAITNAKGGFHIVSSKNPNEGCYKLEAVSGKKETAKVFTKKLIDLHSMRKVKDLFVELKEIQKDSTFFSSNSDENIDPFSLAAISHIENDIIKGIFDTEIFKRRYPLLSEVLIQTYNYKKSMRGFHDSSLIKDILTIIIQQNSERAYCKKSSLYSDYNNNVPEKDMPQFYKFSDFSEVKQLVSDRVQQARQSESMKNATSELNDVNNPRNSCSSSSSSEITKEIGWIKSAISCSGSFNNSTVFVEKRETSNGVRILSVNIYDNDFEDKKQSYEFNVYAHEFNNDHGKSITIKGNRFIEDYELNPKFSKVSLNLGPKNSSTDFSANLILEEGNDEGLPKLLIKDLSCHVSK